ncbi:uncharacterized protein LOC133178786 [Saccostrea echinata]|uniref:uncharacterized protein LOC133178786 n=1 Tax=Saccostrea echinata TaxID=191078 RepID=UPI002A816819|nr:uncharacterized protein LOC133178786 [Saccostrea echinata]
MAVNNRRQRRRRRHRQRVAHNRLVDRENPLELMPEKEIFKRYRFRPNTILFVVNLLRRFLERDTLRSCALTPLLQVMATLRFLATGAFYSFVADAFDSLSPSTVCRAVKDVCHALCQMSWQFIRMPARHAADGVKKHFYSIAGKESKEDSKMKEKCELISYLLIYSTLLQVTILSANNVVDSEYCGFSKSTQKAVKSCPKNKASWSKAAIKLGCSNHKDKCGGNLKYHCVINPWQNETVEVCAPATSIRSGHCAEYNTRGGKIQEFYLQNCKTCKKDYMSAEAYKYQECYLEVYKLNQMQTIGTHLFNKITKTHSESEIMYTFKQKMPQQYTNPTNEENKREQEQSTTSFIINKNYNKHREIELGIMANIHSGNGVIKGKMLHLCVILLHFRALF